MKKHTSVLASCLLLIFVGSTAFAQKTAQDFYKVSQQRLQDRDVRGALAAIDKAIALAPDEAGLYAQRSQLQSMVGNLNAALADMDKALLINPEFKEVYAARSHLRMMKGDMTGALNDLDNAVARGERSANIFAMRGNLRLMTQDYAGALSDFNAAIPMSPDRIGNYLGRAAARNLTGDKAGALADYTYVIDSFEQKEREGTAPDKEARRVRGNDIISPIIRGTEQTKSSDSKVTTRAEMVATMNPELEGTMSAEQMEYLPNVGAAYLNRAHIRSENGDLDAALEDLNKAIAAYPHFGAYEARGKVNLQQRKLDAALADFNKAIELQPGMVFAYIERGETLLRLGRDSEAEKDFAQCLKLDPGMDKMIEESRAAVKGQKQEKP